MTCSALDLTIPVRYDVQLAGSINNNGKDFCMCVHGALISDAHCQPSDLIGTCPPKFPCLVGALLPLLFVGGEKVACASSNQRALVVAVFIFMRRRGRD